MGARDGLTISELSRLAGIPSSSIRFYLREGLISPPLRKGKTRAYYNKKHVAELRRIKRLRERKKLSIEEIKTGFGPALRTIGGRENHVVAYTDRKDDIISTAITLFRSRGYDRININEIAERAGISKGTFYKLFTTKTELFSECADRVFFDIDTEFKELLNEDDIISRALLRASLFFKTRKHMIDLLNVARGAFAENTPRNREKLRLIQANLAGPIADDLNEGIKQGIFRKINTTVLSHMLMGAAEYGIYYCEGKTESEIDHFIRQIVDILLKGLNPGLAKPQ